MTQRVRMKGEGVRKGAWTKEEDVLLKKYIQTYGEGNWYQIPNRAGLNRCRKSCRLRWLNYLRPNIKRGNLQEDEVDMILRLHRLLGNRWSLIAGRIPGRTANDVKNYWNTHLAKHFKPSGSAKKIPKKDNHVVKVNPIKPRPWTFKNLYSVRVTIDEGGSLLPPPPPPPPPQPSSNDDMSWLEALLDVSNCAGEGGVGVRAASESPCSAAVNHLQGWSENDDIQLWDLLVGNDNSGVIF